MKTFIKEKSHTNQQTGAQAIVSTLISNGIDTVFGYPGSPLLSVYETLSKTPELKHILTRHEQGAVHAAEGWAKISGKCGVVIATSGAGFTNTITGLCNANADKTPLLIITVCTENNGKNEFQEVDIPSITKSCVKKSFIITKSEDTEKTISQAITLTEKIPKGPVVIGITKNALETANEQKNYRKPQDIKVQAHHSCILKLIDTLKNAKKPLIIAGGGCYDSEHEVRELHQLTNIPVVNTLMAKGIADDISYGLLGYNGNDHINNCINETDVALVLGSRLSDRTTNYAHKFLPNTKIYNINIEPNKSKNVHIDKELTGELKVILQQIIGAIKVKNVLFDIKYDWLEELSDNEPQINENLTLLSEDVLKTIYNYTKKYNPVITTDVGQHQITASKIFKTISSRHFITSGGFGTMGYGLPAAIGAYIAKPNSLVLNITGDGSFQMNLQELGTCMEYNIPVKIIILNNSSLGMIKNQQIENNYSCFQSNLINPDFEKLANAYGIKGYTITNLENLKQILPEIFVCKRPIVLDIKVNN